MLSKSATAFADLPLASRERAWAADAADARVRRWASSDGSGDRDTMDWPKYRKAFFWYDAEDAENFGSYKLGFADVVDGALTAIPRGVFASAGVMMGARGGVDMPDADMGTVRAHIARYYAKMHREFDDDSIMPPWEQDEQRALATERKALTLALKQDGEKGAFSAVFATFDVIDHDGDVTRCNAFEQGAEVIVGSWGHKSYELPVGKGVIKTSRREVVVEGRFFLDTTAGRDTWQTVKNLGALGEWSYIYRPTKVSFGEFEGQQVRFLEGVQVFSVDPVLAGAGIDTRTTSIKSGAGLPLGEAGDAILAELTDYLERIKSRAAFRAKEGRALSTASRDRLTGIAAALASSATELRGLLADAEPKQNVELVEQYLRFQHIRAELLGVA